MIADGFVKKAVPIDLFRDLLGRFVSSSGKSVTTDTAVQVSTVYAICRVIGEGIAQVPLKLMRDEGRNKTEARDSSLFDILAYRPNSFQTSFEFREMIGWHVVLTGGFFAYKNKVRGEIRELLPFEPGRVTVERDSNWNIAYKVRGKDGSIQEFTQDQIWHVRGPSMDGWNGLNAVRLARDAIGLAMATEEATGTLHKNGVRSSGVYSVEGNLNDKQHAALTEWIERNHAGADNVGKPLILDRAAKWMNTQMTGIDAETLATRRFQIEEICRFARVNPIMVGAESKNSTYASAEQMFLAHLVHTLSPWFQRIEQSIDANLLTRQERADGLYSNFVEEGLLRGSAKDTMDMVTSYVNGGILTPNEGRALLDRNPMSDTASDELRIPANIVGADPAAVSGSTP